MGAHAVGDATQHKYMHWQQFLAGRGAQQHVIYVEQ